MEKPFYKIGAAFAVALLIGSVLAFSTTNADAALSSDLTVEKKGSNTLVSNERGRTIMSSSNSAYAIQWAVDRAPSGGAVTLKSGTYYLSKEIAMKAGVTLQGNGDKTVLVNNGIRLSDVSNVALKSFALRGTADIYVSAYTANIRGIVLQDISARDVQGVNAVFTLDAQRCTISDVSMLRLSAVDCDAYGFSIIGSGAGTCGIRDVTIDGCEAIRCGVEARPNDWVVGFALAVNIDVTNMLVKNSMASYNWEDGFYMRKDVAKTNVVFENCVADHNGVKPAFQEGFGYFIDTSVMLKNCKGVGNKGGLTNVEAIPAPEPEPEPEPVPEPAKGTSSISVTMSSQSVDIGTTIQATGVLTATNEDGTKPLGNVAVTIVVTQPDGSRITTQVTTGADGRFTMAHTPNAAGTYTFAAIFAGNDAYDGSNNAVSWTAKALPAPKPSADLYVYPGNIVKNANGVTVRTGSDAIQWAVDNGNTVLVTAGTYQVSGNIYMRSGTTLMGEGSDKTTLNFARGAIIMNAVSDTAVKGFHITGAASCQSWATGVTVRNHLWEDIHLDHVSRGIINNAIGTWVEAGGVIDGLTYRNVFVDSPATWGFLINGNNFDGWVKNALFEDCTAIRCGNSLGVTDPNSADAWIPGFDLAERCNIDGMRLVNCRADENWESGFHLEIAPEVRNVVFENCTASNNGQKPRALYGAGFFCGDKAGFDECTFIQCSGSGNARGGINYDIPNVRVVSIALPYSS